MRTAIYARVSTLKQDNDNQLIELREFAANRAEQSGRDTATGSGKKDRQQFDQMILAASQHRFDILPFLEA